MSMPMWKEGKTSFDYFPFFVLFLLCPLQHCENHLWGHPSCRFSLWFLIHGVFYLASLHLTSGTQTRSGHWLGPGRTLVHRGKRLWEFRHLSPPPLDPFSIWGSHLVLLQYDTRSKQNRLLCTVISSPGPQGPGCIITGYIILRFKASTFQRGLGELISHSGGKTISGPLICTEILSYGLGLDVFLTVGRGVFSKLEQQN
jgi:hypothetical protein